MEEREKGKGRSQNQRLKLFYLLDYLLEHTDETHTVKAQEISEHLFNYHRIPVEQKTVYSDLHLLDEYGYEVQYDGRTKGWRLIEREFDTQELQLLIDSVQASRFITQKKAKELTDKLKAKAGAWRIPESTLMTVAFIGGSIGAIAGMYLARHKTRHPKFFIGLPAILVMQIAAIILLINR